MISRSMENFKEECINLKTKDFSKVWMIKLENENRYIVKFNNIDLVEGEGRFYNFYSKNKYLPTVMKIHKGGEYLIYTYLKGDTPEKDKKIEVLEAFIENILNEYRPNSEMFGYGLLGKSNSWEDFLKEKVEFAKERIGEILDKENYDFIIKVIEDLCKESDGKLYFMHGNASIQNMLVEGDEFKGIINAKPIIGDPLYDLIYAFTSTPEGLDSKNIKKLLKKVKNDFVNNKKNIYRYLLICLYINIGNCLTNSCNDIVEYVFQWKTWKRRYIEFK